MKPELLIQDLATAGRNNGAIGKTRAKIDKSKSWKKQRIIRLKPADAVISSKVADTHENLIYPPNNGMIRMLAVGMEVGEAYSTAIEQILAHKELSTWEYLLTIEHDNMPPSDGVIRLLEHMEEHPEYSAISGLYFVKGYGAAAQIWGDPKDPVLNFRPQLPDVNGGLVECCGIGMGFALWRLDTFKNRKLRKPWFVTQRRDGVATQDLYFWSDARKHGLRCAVACDVRVGHYSLADDIVW